MKPIVQAFLIGGGILGLVISLPFAFFIWRMSGFASPDERSFVLFMCIGLPALCVVSIVVGGLLGRVGSDLTRENDKAVIK